jgi:hypothetical protein
MTVRSLQLFRALAPLAIAVAGVAGAQESIAVIRQSCAGYGGPEPCFTSLSSWDAAWGGIDFGGQPNGDLVGVGTSAVARIEGTWTEPDTAPLDLSGWVTDATHFIRIYTTPEARHHGVAGTGYRLEVTSVARPIYSTAAHLSIEGLEIYGNSTFTGALVYLNPNTSAGVGEIHLSHNLVHGNGANTGGGLFNYTCRGTVRIWNNIIFDVATPGYTAAIQTGAGQAVIDSNTIVATIAGYGIRADSHTLVRNNLIQATNDDFYGNFDCGSDHNAAGDATAPGEHSRWNQTFSFANAAGRDFHLGAFDTGAHRHGVDLHTDPSGPITDDIDGEARAGGWDIGADQVAGAVDGIAPVRSNGAPTGALPASATQATLSLATNEPASCRCSSSPGVAFASMVDTFSSTDQLHHTRLINVAAGQSYTFYVRCQDSAGNANTGDFEITFAVTANDALPPLVSGLAAVEVTPYGARVSWGTDEPATTELEYGESVSYGHFSVLDLAASTSHEVLLRGLDPARSYHFRARSRDAAGNEAISTDAAFTTSALTQLHYVNQNHPQANDGNPGTETQPWRTIQHAADVAQPGDTIIVYPGSYERVAIQHGGTPGSFVTFKAVTVPDRSLIDPTAVYDPASPVQIPGNSTVNAVTRGFALQPPYGGAPVTDVRIEGFEVTATYLAGAPYPGRGGINLAATERVEIIRNFLHDLNAQPGSYNYMGIRAESHNNIAAVIKGNTLYRVQGTGIAILGRDWLVEDNDVSHGLDTNTNDGAVVGGDSDAVRFFGSGHAIRNNYLHEHLEEEQSGSPHIDCFQTFSVYPDSQYADHILVEGNTCYNMGQMLMVEDQSEVAGTGNKVHHLTFRNNIFRGARAFAFNGGHADYFTFTNNVVADSEYGAIGFSASPFLTVVNNIFYNNGSGSQPSLDSYEGMVWDKNMHFPAFDWPHMQPCVDQHSVFGVDPRFVAPEVGDYRLRPDAPAGFVPLPPCRAFDTRVVSGPAAAAPALAAESRREFVVAGRCGVPADAKAISANLTVVSAAAQGDLRVIGAHLVSTLTSSLSIPLARARANNGIIQLSTDGTGAIAVLNGSSGTVHFILDINGYFR